VTLPTALLPLELLPLRLGDDHELLPGEDVHLLGYGRPNSCKGVAIATNTRGVYAGRRRLLAMSVQLLTPIVHSYSS